MTPISTRPSIGGVSLSGRQRASVIRHRYWEAVLKDQPVVFWPLNEPPGATLVKDWSGNGYDGTVATGHQTLVFAVPGYTSDGATAMQQATVEASSNPPSIKSITATVGLGDHPFTLEAAACSYNTTDNGTLAFVGGVGTGHGWTMFLDAANMYLYSISGNGYWYWTHGVDPTTTDFHHYAISYGGGGATLATVDGIGRGAALISGSPIVNLSSAGIYADGTAANGWDGAMILADVAAYDYALTATQIAAHVAAR